MKIEKIISVIEKEIAGTSLRDREVQRLVKNELKIEKQGHWFILSLLGVSVKIYTSSKYCFNKVDMLITQSNVYWIAKKNVKARFKIESESGE